jgi:hypothetical protein
MLTNVPTTTTTSQPHHSQVVGDHEPSNQAGWVARAQTQGAHDPEFTSEVRCWSHKRHNYSGAIGQGDHGYLVGLLGQGEYHSNS